MFNFFKSKQMKEIRSLSTEEGHKAIICQEKIPHLLQPYKFHISIYSKQEKNCIIYGQIVNTCIEDAEAAVKRWREIVTILPQPIGLLTN